jgi:Ala-tRNA(Pro) deacylase
MRRSAATMDRHLQELGIAHEMLAHPPTFRAMDEAHAVGVPPGAVAKTVVCVDHDDWWLAVVPASRTLDVHRLRERIGGTRHLRLATEAEIAERFAEFDVGATPPIGAAPGARTVVDQLLLDHEQIVCTGGDHEHAIRLRPDALVEAAKAIVADISVHVEDGRRARFSETPLI